MKNTQKSILTAEWLTIKSIYEANTNGSNKYGTNFLINGELDQLSTSFVDKIGKLTEKLGFECIIDGVSMNLWKERIWSLIENAGLQWSNVFAKGNSAGFAIGQPGNAEGLDKDATMWEVFYKYKVSDNITVTPAVFYASNNQAFAGASSNYGGVIQTKFTF